MGFRAALIGGFAISASRPSVIARDALSVLIEAAHVVRRQRVALVRGLAAPPGRFLEVLLSSLPFGMQEAKALLGRCLALIRGLLVPTEGFRVIAGDAGGFAPAKRLDVVLRQPVPFVVQGGKGVFGGRMALISSYAIPVDRFGAVPGHDTAIVVHCAYAELRLGIARLRLSRVRCTSATFFCRIVRCWDWRQ